MSSVERVSHPVSRATSELSRNGSVTRSHERTNEPTDTEANNVTINPAADATRAGGLKDQSIIDPKIGRDGLDPGVNRSDRPPPSCSCTRRWLVRSWGRGPKGTRHRRPAAVLIRPGNAQGYAGRPLTRQTLTRQASCTNSATRRTPAHLIDAGRHHSNRVARSPLAGWHGRSDGSNPLRPPANRPAADRMKQCDCACPPILVAAMPHTKRLRMTQPKEAPMRRILLVLALAAATLAGTTTPTTPIATPVPLNMHTDGQGQR